MKIPRGQTPERQAYMKAWNLANPRDRRAYKTAYDKENQEKIAAYRLAHKTDVKQKNAVWYLRNRERILDRVKRRSEVKKAEILAYHARHYAANSERLKAENAAYRKRNPERKAYIENRRRARKFANGGSHTLADLLEKFALPGNVCF